MPTDCYCGCHEMLKTLSKFSDQSIEDTIKDAKMTQKRLTEDPSFITDYLVLKSLGITEQMWKKVREIVKDK